MDVGMHSCGERETSVADVPVGDARRVRVYSLVVFVVAGHGAL
jgi:hypothetical protein